MNEFIELNLRDGGTVVLRTDEIHTVAGESGGSIVTTVVDGKVTGTYRVYEVPVRIKNMQTR